MDICVNNLLAVHNTELLRQYSLVDSRVRPLVLMVKNWAKRNDIADASKGGLSSYSYTLLTLFFLQVVEPPVLLSLQHPALLQATKTARAPPVEGCDVTFATAAAALQHAGSRKIGQSLMSTGELFFRFFEFYTMQFDWRSDVASVQEGLIQHKLQRWDHPKQWRVSIADPFELGRDLGCTVHSEAKNSQIRATFEAQLRLMRTQMHDQANDDMDTLCNIMAGAQLVETKPNGAKPKAAARKRLQKDTRACHNCGLVGHLSRACPKK